MIKKYFKLPTPKELGWSNTNALTWKGASTDSSKTWEDYDNHCKKHYPIRYFLNETLSNTFYSITRPIEDIGYWIKCHTLPSYCWHKVDLRNVDPVNKYTYGYLDPDRVMFLAAWASLRRYVEKQLDREFYESLTSEELAENDGVLQEQKTKCYDEPLVLYKYWMGERRSNKQKEQELFEIYKKNPTKENFAAWHFYDEDHKEQEMFMKLCALRPYLWV